MRPVFNGIEMDPQQTYLVRKTFAEVQRSRHVAALVFYQRLFALDPSLRPMFRGDIEVQAQKLTDMLGMLIMMLDRADDLEAELRAMGARHKGYGVQDAHYDTVGRALLEMLAAVTGKQWTPDMEAAWTALYGTVESAMKTGAEAAG
jgi:hemoglobin-like flavoprotein